MASPSTNLALYRALVGLKVSEAEAEATATPAVDLSHLATKADIAELRADLNKSLADQLRWLVGVMVAVGGLTVAAIRYLP